MEQINPDHPKPFLLYSIKLTKNTNKNTGNI